MQEQLNRNSLATQASGGPVGNAQRSDITLRENIDQRIRQAEENLKELQDTKARLQTSGLLDTRIDDLSRAMRY